MNKFGVRIGVLVLAAIGTLGIIPASANNLSVSNVSLGSRDINANTVVVEFDVSLENSWRNKINHDAVWLTVRLYDPNGNPVHKKLCSMTAPGINPPGFSAGTSSGMELHVPSDKAGAFWRRSQYSSAGDVSSQNIQLTVDYSSCGFTSRDEIVASVMAIEMVFIPQGAFYAGDNASSAASLDQGSSDSDPWYINSESAISVTNAVSNGFRYVTGGNTGEDPTGAQFTIPASFPKGYNAFYVMKYEITEGQWVEFINALPSVAARARHDITDTSHKNSDTVIDRNSIACSGSPVVCSSSRPARALGYLSWRDLTAFLDWAALRPISELEFEKIARGPVLPINGEYAWGATDIIAVSSLSPTQEDGTETVTTTGANAHYNDTSLSGGDSTLGVEHQKGPLLTGIFSSSSSDRVSSGAGYYGVMELSGNLNEWVVTIGNTAGRNFTAVEGNGILSLDPGYEGNADAAFWPGMNAVATRGITDAAGAGLRGGSWMDSADRLRISDRSQAALETTQATNTYGGRGARTYDGE